MTTYMFIGMIAGAALGLLVAHPTMNLPVFTGFHNDTLGDMFPNPVRYGSLWCRFRIPQPGFIRYFLKDSIQ